MANKQKMAFNAEIQQLLNLVIHSLYSKKEIFLRELISNASDAIDKRKFAALTQPEMALQGDYKIELHPNPESQTLTIKDNGIGMSPSEVQEFIGTIARSGSKKFAELNQQAQQNPELIGQFGVGFYSAFMVAKKVHLHTQKAGTTVGALWESEGQGEYTLTEVPRPEGSGTTITLELKAFDEEDKVPNFTDSWTIKDLVKTYSNYIAYPVYLYTSEKPKPATASAPSTTEASAEGAETATHSEADLNSENQGPEIINSQKALWLKSPSEVSKEEHEEFYKHLSKDWNSPTKWWHWRAEGSIEFTSLIYLPGKKPWNYNMKDYEYGLSLYIKKVFIMDHNKDLLPPYLRFLKGMVDCNDLPLNVSREILQHDRQIQIIKKNVLNKAFAGLKEMMEQDRSQYEVFFNEFGSTLKEGIAIDAAQKNKIAELLLFRSSASEKGLTSLTEYVSRMPSSQNKIYFITGDSIERVANSPYMERLKEKGWEVLYMVDPVDEWVVRELTQFQERPLQSITQDNLDLETEEEKNQSEAQWKTHQERFGALLEKMGSTLKDQVKAIRLSKRLKSTPSCLVQAEGDMSMQMQKILKQMGENTWAHEQKRVLELNPSHPMVERLLTLSPESQANWTEILYYQALISEGTPLTNPQRYTQLVTDQLTGSGLN